MLARAAAAVFLWVQLVQMFTTSTSKLFAPGESSGQTQHRVAEVHHDEKFKASAKNVSRIVGGSAVVQKHFLFVVSIQRKVTKTAGTTLAQPLKVPMDNNLNSSARTPSQKRYRHFCGGSLLHPTWVLTAAHCIHTKLEKDLRIVGNVLNIKHNLKDRRISANRSIHVHPGFQSKRLAHDIALIKLQTPLNDLPLVRINQSINGTTKSAFMKGFEAVGQSLKVLGWGRKSETSKAGSSQLFSVSVPVASPDFCKQIYSKRVDDTKICAGFQQGGKDSCHGDSGGPLGCFDASSGSFIQVGVVSFGRGCARENFYGVYSRTSFYAEWIESTIIQVEKGQ